MGFHKKTWICLGLFLLWMGGKNATQASAIYALGVGLTVDANTLDAVALATTFYNLDGNTHASNLPASLGVTINPTQGGTLLLAGSTGKTWQAPADDAQNLTLFYRVFETGTVLASRPTFTSYNLLYQNQWNPDGNINKYWSSNSAPGTVNLLSGLALGTVASPKSYTVEFYGTSVMNYSGGSFTAYDNNGGANFSTSFQLVPEPSTTALLGTALAALLPRRRRKSS